ncbi:MAG: hypothetical protein IRZ31_17290 [Thermogemmatispora sp.]|uniref:hypothetical protein n=1 Tax=Thermogemmatispora sp. TaxID=1968838 RepID=UPI00261F55A4|nr:hypothetical protein [Thermogemmatispora sp.]MBX5458649.1 hypothetical protein [Thermogemmatispora sp.]
MLARQEGTIQAITEQGLPGLFEGQPDRVDLFKINSTRSTCPFLLEKRSTRSFSLAWTTHLKSWSWIQTQTGTRRSFTRRRRPSSGLQQRNPFVTSTAAAWGTEIAGRISRQLGRLSGALPGFEGSRQQRLLIALLILVLLILLILIGLACYLILR